MVVRSMTAAMLLLAPLAACTTAPEEASRFPFFAPHRAETEAYVRAIEAGMAHAERVQEMRRSAARRVPSP